MAVVSLRSSSPFDGILELQSALERMLGSSTFGSSGLAPGGNVFPPVNVFADKDGAVVVQAEVPGIDPESMVVNVEGRRLTLSGERKPSEGKASYHRRERQYGKFSRTVQLPEDLDPQSASASYKHGVLTIRVAKQEAAKPRKIEIHPS